MAQGSRDVSAVYELMYNPDYMPRSSPRAHIESLEVDGEPSFILMKQSEGEYYEVDSTTREIWRLLDGKKTVREIFNQVKSLDDSLTEKDVKDVIVSLAEEGTIETTESEIKKKRVEIVSAFQLNVQLIRDTSKSLAGFFRITRKLIRKPELPIGLGITAVGFLLFYGSFIRIFVNPSILDVAGSALLGFFFYQMIVLLPVYAVHELAHAAMCDYYGGKPGEIGTGLYYTAPFFYCDTSDAWRLSRRARIMISVAGPFSTVVISAFLVFWSYLTPVGYLKDVLEIGAFFGFYGTLTNFSPVIETDGYYILADVLNIPNLRDEAFASMKRFFLRVLRRPAATVRQSVRHRRLVFIYALVTIVWLAFFVYTTTWLMGIYGVDSYLALSSLVMSLIGLKPFDLTTATVNVATLAYFGLIVAGYGVMGAVSYQKVRMKGVKLETIHDKRVSVLLPLPSDIHLQEASKLVNGARKLGRGYSRSSTVTLQPPLCVAEIRLGRVDQSLEAMREEMRRIEESFRELHSSFLTVYFARRDSTPKGREVARSLVDMAQQFPSLERGRAVSAVSQFIRLQDRRVNYLLQAAFGTIWTLELSPEDYERMSRGMLSSLIAEDLSITDLPAEVEDFKKRIILEPDALAKLSTEIEAESREVRKRPEVYQTTAFLEPVKSRLVFVGRTDKVEGASSWLGGLYLYQAWTSYIREALDEAVLGLKAIRQAHLASLTKAQAGKLQDPEVEAIGRVFDRTESLERMVADALGKVESTFESAKNFHEALGGLVEDESFDIGLYKPILTANGKHLEGVGERIDEFRTEFEQVSKKLAASREQIAEERSRRAAEGLTRRRNSLRSLLYSWGGVTGRNRTPAFDSQVKLAFAINRLVYGIIVGGDTVA